MRGERRLKRKKKLKAKITIARLEKVRNKRITVSGN